MIMHVDARMGKTTFQKAEFEVLKQRLLLRELDEVGIWEAHLQIMQEAEVAGEIASQTPFPALVFPSLFEERVGAVLQQFHRRETAYWRAFRPIVNGVGLRTAQPALPLPVDPALTCAASEPS